MGGEGGQSKEREEWGREREEKENERETKDVQNDVFVCPQSTNPYFTCGWRQWLRWTPSSSIKQDISLKVSEVEEDRKEKEKRRMKKNKSVKEKEWGDFFFFYRMQNAHDTIYENFNKENKAHSSQWLLVYNNHYHAWI